MVRNRGASFSAVCDASAARWKRSETRTSPIGRWTVVDGARGVDLGVVVVQEVGGAAVFVVVAASIEFVLVCSRVGARAGIWGVKQGSHKERLDTS